MKKFSTLIFTALTVLGTQNALALSDASSLAATATDNTGTVYEYTIPTTVTTAGEYQATGGTFVIKSGTFETKNGLYGVKSSSAVTATAKFNRVIKVNDCIELTMFCSSSNKSTGLDITMDGETSVASFPLPSGNQKTSAYTVSHIVSESDVALIGKDSFNIKKISFTDNLYLQGVKISIPSESAPVFTSSPASKTVVKGATVILTAKANGFPEPTYQWYLNGEAVDGATGETYELNVTAVGENTVYVKATNSLGSVKSDDATITVINQKVTLEDDKYVVSGDDQVADKLRYITPNLVFMLCDGGGYSVASADASTAPEGYTHIINGSSNPVVSTDGKVTGAAYAIQALNDGKFILTCKLNAEKAIRVKQLIDSEVTAKAADASEIAQETATLVDKTFYLGDTETTSGTKLTETYYGDLSFDVLKDDIYYIYLEGSKISMYGFDFTESTGINDVTADKVNAAAPVKYVKDGKIVIAKDGKFYNAAGAQIK